MRPRRVNTSAASLCPNAVSLKVRTRGGSRGGVCGVATPPKHSHCTASPRAHARMYVRT